jgi:hypothetical protein
MQKLFPKNSDRTLDWFEVVRICRCRGLLDEGRTYCTRSSKGSPLILGRLRSAFSWQIVSITSICWLVQASDMFQLCFGARSKVVTVRVPCPLRRSEH